MTVSEIVAEILGRKPDQEELDRIRSIASVLRIRENDPFFLLIAILTGFGGEYERFPEKIEHASSIACEAAAKRTRLSINELAASAQSALCEAVSKSAQEAAKAASVSTMFRWLATGSVIMLLVLCGLAWFMYSQGVKSGMDRGFAQARSEEIVLSSNSELGQRAISLFEEGKLKEVLDFPSSELGRLIGSYNPEIVKSVLLCRKRGWEIEKASDGNWACFPEQSGFPMPLDYVPHEKKSIMEKLNSKNRIPEKK